MNLDTIKKLRQVTNAGISDIRQALEEADGDEKQALKELEKIGHVKVKKRSDRLTNQGLVEAYTHMGKIGALVEVNCETDFVARNPKFKELVHEIALVAAGFDGDSIAELLKQPTINQPAHTVGEQVKSASAKFGEKIEVRRFFRYVLGQE